MSQMPDKIWLHKDTKYNIENIVYGYQYELARKIKDEGTENFVEYICKDALIDKACKWLEEHLLDYWQQSVTDSTNFINDFQKAMGYGRKTKKQKTATDKASEVTKERCNGCKWLIEFGVPKKVGCLNSGLCINYNAWEENKKT